MDLDRIRSACDLTEKHVTTIAAYRRSRTRTFAKTVISAPPVRPTPEWWRLAGAAIGVIALAVLFALTQHAVSPVDLGDQQDVPAARATPAGPAAPGVELVSMATVLDGMKRARTITLAAFSLRHDAEVVRTLEAAAGRKASVSVVLASGFGIDTKQNAQTARELAAHGVRVHLVRTSQHFTHIEATVVDGQVYLSDRTWTTSPSDDALVVHDSIPGDRVLIEESFEGRAGANDHLWTRKADALLAEADMIATRHSQRIRISTESFGSGTAVYRRLVERRKAGDAVTLLVARSEYQRSSTEKAVAFALRWIGVEIRLSASNEKLAVDGDSVWMGSANATEGAPDQLDFGIVVTSGDIADRLNKQFDREWDKAVAP